MARYILIFLTLCALPLAARATQCSVPQTFVTGEVLTAAVLNANPVALAACINGGIDNTNIGPAGIYASQIIPTTVGQATFGGGVNYTFPVGISTAGYADIGGGNSANLLSGDVGASRSATSGAIRLGGATSSGTLDFGASHAGKFTLTGGAFQTTVAQSCGTISGYHIECGSVTIANCLTTQDCTGSGNFTTNFTGTPTCADGLTGANAQITLVVTSVTSSVVNFSMHNFGGSTATGTATYLCIGV